MRQQGFYKYIFFFTIFFSPSYVNLLKLEGGFFCEAIKVFFIIIFISSVIPQLNLE